MGGTDSPENRIRVVLRCRPPNKQERDWFANGTQHPILRAEEKTPDPEQTIIIDESNKVYNYDTVFRDEITQAQVFKTAAMPTLENVFKGYCGAVLCYGQTGTGKTHTMQGYAKGNMSENGIIPRTAEYIFDRIEKDSTCKFEVTMSVVQIYLDKLQDLFNTDAPEININPEVERVELPGITTHTLTNSGQFIKLYFQAEKHRITRATNMNPTSSRGHAATIVNIKIIDNAAASTKIGKLVLVDLAGYERFTATGVTGLGIEEAKKINASLLALGGVVNALADQASSKKKNSVHIPYRNSKLTRLLKDCLGGSSQSTIILTMGPCDLYSQETAGTLYFGWRAMAVKVDAKIKEEYDPAKYLANLKNKLKDTDKWVYLLVKFFSKETPEQYQEFIKKYGEPEYTTKDDDGEEEISEKDKILAAMHNAPGLAKKSKISMGFVFFKAVKKFKKPLKGRSQSPVMQPADVVSSDSEDEGHPKPLVRQSAREMLSDHKTKPAEDGRDFDEELEQLRLSAEKELDMLRLRHIQDLEEATKSGATQEMLANLQKGHENELKNFQESHFEMRDAILEEKHHEELKIAVARIRSIMNQSEEEDQERQEMMEMVQKLADGCNSREEFVMRILHFCRGQRNQAVRERKATLTLSRQMTAGSLKPTPEDALSVSVPAASDTRRSSATTADLSPAASLTVKGLGSLAVQHDHSSNRGGDCLACLRESQVFPASDETLNNYKTTIANLMKNDELLRNELTIAYAEIARLRGGLKNLMGDSESPGASPSAQGQKFSVDDMNPRPSSPKGMGVPVGPNRPESPRGWPSGRDTPSQAQRLSGGLQLQQNGAPIQSPYDNQQGSYVPLNRQLPPPKSPQGWNAGLTGSQNMSASMGSMSGSMRAGPPGQPLRPVGGPMRPQQPAHSLYQPQHAPQGQYHGQQLQKYQQAQYQAAQYGAQYRQGQQPMTPSQRVARSPYPEGQGRGGAMNRSRSTPATRGVPVTL